MCYFIRIPHEIFILQNKKVNLPLLSRFAYFLVLLLGFHLLITFVPYRNLFSNDYFILIFLLF